MKSFLRTFVICIILSYVFLLIIGGLISENGLALLVFVAFVITVIITIFTNQESKIEDLEKRLTKLEEQNKENE
ncbi:hypothetical protein [Sedimentibacter sp. B4]|uniref:hypothetical protein n=1 Tax=Sedimentibacter sp. B4 TaxID=304766 RepID=UPI00030E646E|nr:hypothetical protein [Sedimentibacter sp. B4]